MNQNKFHQLMAEMKEGAVALYSYPIVHLAAVNSPGDRKTNEYKASSIFFRSAQSSNFEVSVNDGPFFVQGKKFINFHKFPIWKMVLRNLSSQANDIQLMVFENPFELEGN